MEYFVRRRRRRGRRPRQDHRDRHRALRVESLERRELLAGDLSITEFMASNDSTLLDSDGNSPDWIELHNASAETIDLAGWKLTDDQNNLEKWAFSTFDLAPDGYLVVFASGQDRQPASHLLTTDLVTTEDGTFVVDLPNGQYQLQLTMGDADRTRDVMAIYVQGQLREIVTAEQGEFVVTTLSAEITAATGGQLQLRFEDQGGLTKRVAINALTITPTAGGESTRFDFGQTTSPVEPLYVAVTADDLYNPGVGHGWLPGAVISDQDRGLTQSGPHTNFRLRSDGEYVGLVSPEGDVVSEFGSAGTDYPPQSTDVSYGVPADGSAAGYLAAPTPGRLNTNKRSTAVTADRSSGVFTAPFALTLAVDTPGATIHFTTDGSAATAESPVYTEPIPVAATMQVEAIATAPGFAPSTPMRMWYLMVAPDLQGFTSDLPVIVLDNFAKGRPGQSTFQFNAMAVFEPDDVGARTSLLTPPSVATRAGLKVRGSSTAGRPKSAFTVETWDTRNDDQDVSLLGMPSDSDWILYAPYNFDRALIRNPFIYELSNQAGRYAVRTRFVEVFHNTGGGNVSSNDYVGLYVLMEKIKGGPDRVDVQELGPADNHEPDVTGGWMLKIDRADPGDQGFRAAGQTIRYVEPKEDDVSGPQAAWIKDYFNDMGATLTNPDPETGYAQYIDVDSWIDHHILNVLPMNVDAFRLSGYFHKDRGGKIVMGPIWDFDRSMESDDDRDDRPLRWDGSSGTRFFDYTWWNRLFDDPNFMQKWTDRWFELRRDVLSDANINGVIDSMAAEITEAQARNFDRWRGVRPRTRSPGGFNVGALDGTWEGEIAQMKAWLIARADWIDSQFVLPPSITPDPGRVAAGQEVTLRAPAGTVYYTTDGSDPRLPGGAISATASAYDGSSPPVVSAALPVIARSLSGSQWSAPVDGIFLVRGGPDDVGSLVVSEINFHPYAPTDTELALNAGWTRDDFEFIELANTGGHTIDLTGVTLVDGIDFTVAGGIAEHVQPGQFRLVVANQAAFQARYGDDLPVIGQFAGPRRLNDEGERIALADRYGFIVQDFQYQDSGQWPGRADGAGSTLERIDTADAAAGADAWRASSEFGGSPGSPGAGPVVDVLVNEVLSRGAGGTADQIELFNTTSNTIDLSGWYVSDDKDQLLRHTIPNGQSIGPGEYIVLSTAQLGFGLNGAQGDDVWLLEADASGRPVRFADHVEFDGSDIGVALGRWPNGDPAGILFPMTGLSLGATNPGPLTAAAVISEVHYNPLAPPSFGHDFSAGTAAGFNSLLGTWQVRDGRYEVTPNDEGNALATLTTGFALPEEFDFTATLNIPSTSSVRKNGAMIFDYRSETDFKFALMPASADLWRLGQRDENGWNFAAQTSGLISTDVDFDVTVEIRGSVVRVRSNGVVKISWDFGTDLSGGQLGLGSNRGMVRFDNVAVEAVSNPQLFEFIEIANTTSTTINLEGWQLAGGVDLTMATGTTIGAGETLVAVGFDPNDTVTTAAFRDRFVVAATTAIVGPYTGSLSNRGETVRLLRPLVPGDTESEHALADQVGYENVAPWPTAADGTGQSLQRLQTALFGNSAANWRSLPASPGETHYVATGDMNLDGVVNGLDIADFVLALSNPSAYATKHGIPAAVAGDANGDGTVDGNDIDDFVLRVQQK